MQGLLVSQRTLTVRDIVDGKRVGCSQFHPDVISEFEFIYLNR